jgi:hypothetical protein
MTAIHPSSELDEMQDSTLISVTDERKVGLSQHRLFCECGNIITAPLASAYIEAGGIRHVWVCDSCGQSFETAIAPVNEAASREPAAPPRGSLKEEVPAPVSVGIRSLTAQKRSQLGRVPCNDG